MKIRTKAMEKNMDKAKCPGEITDESFKILKELHKDIL